MVLERKMKMWKFYGLTDDGQQEIRKAHLRSGEVKIVALIRKSYFPEP